MLGISKAHMYSLKQKFLYEYGKETGSSVRVLQRQYSAYALRKSALTPRKSVVGTIVKREVNFLLFPIRTYTV